MSNDIYYSVIGTETGGMKRHRAEMTVVIYESADCVRDHDFRTETNTYQPPQQTGSDSVKSRSRAAVVCLVLLCVLLLTAVIVLCVHIHTNCTVETNQLLTKVKNLTEERDELIKTGNMSDKGDQLINQLSLLCTEDEWIYYKSSCFYISSKTKNWNKSRQDCLNRGADLIIINDSKKQDFVRKITDKREFWIGLTDIDVEGTWKWVNGINITFGFWASGEPNGGGKDNCAVTYLTHHSALIGWFDVKCDDAYQWICEKSILPLKQP